MDDSSGEMVMLSEWNIGTTSDTTLPLLRRQLSSLEQEINYLIKLRHQNLSHYLSMKYDCNDDEDAVVVYILREFVYGNLNILFRLDGDSRRKRQLRWKFRMEREQLVFVFCRYEL